MTRWFQFRSFMAAIFQSLLLVVTASGVMLAGEDGEIPKLAHREVVRVSSSAYVYSLDVSEDGKQLAWCSFMGEDVGEDIEVLDVDSFERIASCRYGGVINLAFNPRDGMLALLGDDPLIWDFENGIIRFMETSPEFTLYMNGVFAPDSSKLAAVGPDNTVTIWDVQSRRIHRQLQHMQNVTCIDVSAEFVASCCFDGVFVWDVETGEAVGSFRTTGVLADGDGNDPAEIRPQAQYPDSPVLLQFSPAENVCAVMVHRYEDSTLQCLVELWELNVENGVFSAERVGQIESPRKGRMNLDLSFSPDGRLVALCASHGRGLVFDVERLEPFATWEHPNADPSIVAPDEYTTFCADFADGGAALATGHADGSIVIWEIPNYRE